MICRRCLQRASALITTRAPAPAPASKPLFPHRRPLSTTLAVRNAAAAAAAPAAPETDTPTFGTPLENGETEKVDLSSCPAGTVLTGLNYFKSQQDPVALADDKYPEWLWKCLEVQKKHDEGETDDLADEFSKSKKQRRIAMKRQRLAEARLLAEGNLEALAPKIPLQHQSINMPANEENTADGALAAAAAREELRKAMRKERKAKIKETNYLKSM